MYTYTFNIILNPDYKCYNVINLLNTWPPIGYLITIRNLGVHHGNTVMVLPLNTGACFKWHSNKHPLLQLMCLKKHPNVCSV